MGGLAVAIAVYVVLALWLTRGTTFTADEIDFFAQARLGFDPAALLIPYNSHLLALNRLIYAGTLELFGPSYVVIRLVMVATLVTVAVLLFALLRERAGPVVALAGTVVVLFLGSTPVVLAPVTMTFAQATAAGLGAFLALERRSSRGDILACVLLVLAVLSWSIGMAFVAGAAVLVLLGRDRWRRAYVFFAPVVVYGAWWLWSQKFGQSMLTVSNVLLIPNYAADSLAAAAGALSGLNTDFSNTLRQETVGIGWGRIVTTLVIVATVMRLRRVGLSAALIAFLAALAAIWISGALSAGPLRTPEESRYVYAVAIGVLLVVAEAFRGIRLSRGAALGVLLVAALALPANLAQLRQTGAELRLQSTKVRAQLGVLELARRYVEPGFYGGLALPVQAGDYLAAVDQFGSFAFEPGEIPRQPAGVRAEADALLERIARPRVVPAPTARPTRCLARRGGLAGPARVRLPAGGAVLRSDRGGPVRLRRFAGRFTIQAGPLAAGRFGRLALPVDAARLPGFALLPAGGSVTICPLAPERGTFGAPAPG